MRMFGRITPEQERQKMLDEAHEEAVKHRWLATHAAEISAYHLAQASLYEERSQRLLAPISHNASRRTE